MLKFLVLVVILCQGLCEERHDDTSMPLLSPTDTVVNVSSVEMLQAVPGFSGQYFYSPHQTININGNRPPAWRWPTHLGNAGTELRPDYVVMSIGGLAHKVHIRKLKWNAARRFCIEEGGHLADIRTIEEMKAIKALMLASSVDIAWVGFHDLFQEGDWVTVLDEPIGRMLWTPWTTKYNPNPDNYQGKQNCAAFPAKYDGIDDNDCSKEFSFVCKISIKC